jgi:hypothetical protein
MTAMDLRLAADARALVEAVLEDYAADVFDPHVVAVRIRRATKSGQLAVQLHQDRALDLRETGAAKGLRVLLANLGYETDWVDARKFEHQGKGEPAREYVYLELVIRWHLRAFADWTN